MEFLDAISSRHSEYSLDGAIGVSEEEVLARIRSVAERMPSAYNGQSARAFVLFGDDHREFWRIVADVLLEKIGEERFKRTGSKIASFSAAAGTVLFYEIDSVTEELIETYPSYAHAFPAWAEHGNAMLQFAVWTAITDMGLGANIQHYNPLVDDRAREAFGIPDGYRLIAQMPFGRILDPSPGKKKLDGSETVRLAHAIGGHL